ncbi:YceD family protein [Jannaschia seohaensis]|uniref:Uncharacterized ACR, COG1399 n=1 Tax=Jannaschia seohaensis TaxID=475081 RepID=A0A2Y9AMK4_9RHOB|nr:DUF177 domain-containing protein [Jannaschia seohaensis]PWJ19097.1 uncharacterized protein DUF177 involved in 23S rRNA accumulation [Jannaschia seohaensis]SSA45721.1 Uncharacterized ACR, COG1399 [Jannaschia seohaensis]
MTPILSKPLRLSDLPQRKPTPFRLVPDEGQLEALADRMDVDVFRKLRFEGVLKPGPGRDWTVEGHLGATVVQPCRVTTDPVTTRIEEDVTRRFAADYTPPTGDEVEMGEDDDAIEPLPAVLDLGDLLEEALALAIPAYPRAEGAEEIDLTAAPAGAAPLDDDKVKPFAGLAALKARMEGKEDREE